MYLLSLIFLQLLLRSTEKAFKYTLLYCDVKIKSCRVAERDFSGQIFCEHAEVNCKKDCFFFSFLSSQFIGHKVSCVNTSYLGQKYKRLYNLTVNYRFSITCLRQTATVLCLSAFCVCYPTVRVDCLTCWETFSTQRSSERFSRNNNSKYTRPEDIEFCYTFWQCSASGSRNLFHY